MGLALTLALAGLAAAHVMLLVGLARRGAFRRAVAACAVPPLAPWWGWQAGLRRTTIAWGASLALYAALSTLGVSLTGR